MRWKRARKGGVGWRYEEGGGLLIEQEPHEVLSEYMARRIVDESDGAWRTAGSPSTMADLITRYHEYVATECYRYGLFAPLVYALIGVETIYSKRQQTRDFFALRFEPPFKGWDADEANNYNPDEWFSAGLMQTRTLESKAAVKRDGLQFFDTQGQPRAFEPGDLCVPSNALAIGCSHLAHIARRKSNDPMKLNAIWNTGRFRPTDSTRFGVYIHNGDVRVAYFAAYYMDALAVLVERDLYTGVPPDEC